MLEQSRMRRGEADPVVLCCAVAARLSPAQGRTAHPPISGRGTALIFAASGCAVFGWSISQAIQDLQPAYGVRST